MKNSNFASRKFQFKLQIIPKRWNKLNIFEMISEQIKFCETCVPSYCPPCCKSRKFDTGTLFLNCERLKHNGLLQTIFSASSRTDGPIIVVLQVYKTTVSVVNARRMKTVLLDDQSIGVTSQKFRIPSSVTVCKRYSRSNKSTSVIEMEAPS